jgi:hypothetical protein
LNVIHAFENVVILPVCNPILWNTLVQGRPIKGGGGSPTINVANGLLFFQLLSEIVALRKQWQLGETIFKGI